MKVIKTNPVVVEVAWLLGDDLENTSPEDFAEIVERMRTIRDANAADGEAEEEASEGVEGEGLSGE